jgi:hypothetical protein
MQKVYSFDCLLYVESFKISLTIYHINCQI